MRRVACGALALLQLACLESSLAIKVSCRLMLGAELHSVAVAADYNATVAEVRSQAILQLLVMCRPSLNRLIVAVQLAGLAGGKLVKKLRLSTGVVLSDLETEGAWLDPDDKVGPLDLRTVEGQVVGWAEESGLAQDITEWRALADDEGHWLHEVAGKYGFACTLDGQHYGALAPAEILGESDGHAESIASIMAASEVSDVLDYLAQPSEPQDEAIDFWADEAMLMLEQLRGGGEPFLESEDPVAASLPELSAQDANVEDAGYDYDSSFGQIGDWLSNALDNTIGYSDGDEEQWGGIILDEEEEERYWAQHEAEMRGDVPAGAGQDE